MNTLIRKTIKIQKTIKGKNKRKQFLKLKENTIKIKSIFEGYKIRKKFKIFKTKIINFIEKLNYELKRDNYRYLIKKIKKKIKSLKFLEILREEKVIKLTILKEEIEGENEKLLKILKGNGTGIKSFPRPYCEIGSNLKVLKKLVEKGNDLRDDLFCFKAADIKYSGITSQLILNFSDKTKLLNDIVNGDFNKIKNKDFNNNDNINDNLYDFEDAKNLAQDVYESKVYLKSKNITSKSHFFIHKKFIGKLFYFHKKYIVNYENEIKKILVIQRNFKYYLFRKKYLINVKFFHKKIIMVKVFKIILRECIVNSTRRNVLKDFKNIIYKNKELKKINDNIIINKDNIKENENNNNGNLNVNININVNENNYEKNIKEGENKNSLSKNNNNFNIEIKEMNDKEDTINNLKNKNLISENKPIIKEKKKSLKENKVEKGINKIKKTNDISVPITKNYKEEVKKETLQYQNNNNNYSNDKNMRKKKIFINTKIIDDEVKNNNAKENKLNNNFIVIRGTIDSNDSPRKSQKRINKNKKKNKEITIESSGSIIFNDKEIYVNKNLTNNYNEKPNKIRSAFFNIIVNNIKK